LDNNASDNSTKLTELESGGWEWTSSAFVPFTGFEADPLYPEYSVDFFDGWHYVLKGSCPYTHPSMKRGSFRNYYQRQYRNMFAKFRLVKEEGESVAV
jgi:formylglycine-generating enzyme required for sulfatase activity